MKPAKSFYYFHDKVRSIYRNLKSIYYFGSNYYCIFCKRYYRKFLSLGIKQSVFIDKNIIGGGYRQNAKCPVCSSTDRERLLYLFISKKTNLFRYTKPIKVLHIAPEKNLQKIIKSRPSIKYYCVDIDQKFADIKMNITQIKFDDNFFDVTICCHVLEHIIEDSKAISELYRVLKPNGWAILQVPYSKNLAKTFEDLSIILPDEREIIFGQKDHVRIYGKDYKKRVENAGFKVYVNYFAKKLDEKIVKLYAINKEEPIFYCKKEIRESI